MLLSRLCLDGVVGKGEHGMSFRDVVVVWVDRGRVDLAELSGPVDMDRVDRGRVGWAGWIWPGRYGRRCYGSADEKHLTTH